MTQQLAKVLAKLMGFKVEGDYEKAKQVVNDGYNDLFDTDREYFIALDHSDFIERLKTEKKFSDDHLEALARLYFEDAELLHHDLKFNLYQKALSILIYLNKEQKMYSFDREKLMKEIQSRLN